MGEEDKIDVEMGQNNEVVGNNSQELIDQVKKQGISVVE